jgi:hypothetical protein
MATATTLQSLNSDADFGGVSTARTSNRSQIETFVVRNTNGSGITKAVAAGQWVSFDTDQTGADRVRCVSVVNTSGGAVAIGVPVIGVALDNVSIPEPGIAGQSVEVNIRVVIGGYVENASVATGSTEGLALTLDTTTSGRATIADAANVNICGVALEDAVSNAADVWVFKKF